MKNKKKKIITLGLVAPLAAGIVPAQSGDLIATAATVNQAPVVGSTFTDVFSRVSDGDVRIVLLNYFRDADGDVLNYVPSSSDESKVTAEVVNGILILTPKAKGYANITVEAQDGKGGVAKQTFRVDVYNDPPSIKVIENKTVNLTDRYLDFDISPYFSDPNGDNLSYRLTSLNESIATVMYQGSFVRITPKGIGTVDIRVQLTDGSATVQRNFKVTVNPSAPIAVRNLSGVALNENQIQLSFDKGNFVNEYIIKRNGVEISRTTENTFTDSGLSKATAYEYQVSGVNQYGVGPEQSIRVSTLGDVVLPEEPPVEQEPVQPPIEENPPVEEPSQPPVEEETPDTDAPLEGETPTEPEIEEQVSVTLDGTSANLSWDAIEGSNGYRIEAFQKDENGDYQPYSYARTASGTNYAFKGLSPDAQYQFKIIPRIDWRYEYPAAITGSIQVEATEEVVESNEPANIQNIIGEVVGDSIELEWDSFSNQDEEAIGYKIQAYVEDENGNYVKESYSRTSSTNSYTFTNLDEGQSYKFEITPRTSTYLIDKAGWSEAIELPTMTLDEQPNETPVTVGEATATVSGQTVVLSWNALDDASAYRVQRYKLEDGIYVRDGYGKNSFTLGYTDDNLEAGSYKYEITPRVNSVYDVNQIFSVTAEVQGSDLDSDNVSAPISEKVQNLTADVNELSAILQWDTFNDSTYYRLVTYIKDEAGVYQKQASMPTVSGTTRTVSLEEGKEYKFEIIPRTKVGYAFDQAATVEVTTN